MTKSFYKQKSFKKPIYRGGVPEERRDFDCLQI